MKSRLISAVLLLVLPALALSGRAAGAAPAATGITISPAFQMVTIQPSASEQPVVFKITNNRPVAQDLSFAVRDFNTLNESGGLFFVGTNPTALQKKYGLAKWFSLPTTSLTIPAGQTATLNASIVNLPDLSPGGHYGALMISLGDGNSAGKVGLQPIASSLLFVTKPGGDTHRLGLSSVSFSHTLFKLPGSVNLRFHNDGNTHLVPRGNVYLEDPSGKVISKGIINDDSGIILPETYRRYFVPMRTIASSNKVGKYKLRIDYRFDGFDGYRSYQKSFWHLPTIAAALAVVIFVVAGGVFWHFRPRRHKSDA